MQQSQKQKPRKQTFNTQSDAEKVLIEGAMNGIESAFTKLYNENYSSVLNSIYNKIKDMPLAEDITSVAFVKAFNYLKSGKYEPDKRFSSLVFRIASNKMIDEIRKQKTKPKMSSISTGAVKETGELIYEVQVEDVSMDINSYIANSAIELFIEEEKQELWAKRMTSQLQMLNLRILQGFSEKQAAEKLDISIAEVKSRTHTLRKYLKMRIEQKGLNVYT